MIAHETVKKLVLYAEHKRRAKNPDLDVEDGEASILSHVREAGRLKRELLNEGVSLDLLNLTGDEIADVIYSTIHKYV